MTSVVKFSTINNRQPLSLRNFLLSKNFIQSHAIYIQNYAISWHLIFTQFTQAENTSLSFSVVATVFAREREREFLNVIHVLFEGCLIDHILEPNDITFFRFWELYMRIAISMPGLRSIS